MSDDINVNMIAEQLAKKVDLPSNKGQDGIDYVVEWKVPTESDPTWYRVYKSGWVEQGGIGTSQQYNVTSINATFPKIMGSTAYSAILTAGDNTQQSWDFGVRIAIKYVNGLDVRGGTNGGAAYTGKFHWQVSGQGA